MLHSWHDFYKDLTAGVLALEIWKREALEKAGKLIEEEAKRVIGTYEYGWPQLAESTQRQRERLGFPPNEPLLRTRELKDSIEHTVIEYESAVDIGSNHPIAKFQELGTSRIPPRSYLGGAARAKEREIHEKIGKGFYIAIAAPLGLAAKELL